MAVCMLILFEYFEQITCYMTTHSSITVFLSSIEYALGRLISTQKVLLAACHVIAPCHISVTCQTMPLAIYFHFLISLPIDKPWLLAMSLPFAFSCHLQSHCNLVCHCHLSYHCHLNLAMSSPLTSTTGQTIYQSHAEALIFAAANAVCS